MDHLYTYENVEYRKNNINIRNIGHNPKKSVLYARLKNKTKREYYTGRSTILPPPIFTNYFDNYDNYLSKLLYNNTFFLCGICFNGYNITDKFNIRCGHYICNNCLILITNSHISRCPYCRIELINHNREIINRSTNQIPVTNDIISINSDLVPVIINNNSIESRTTFKQYLHLVFILSIALFFTILLMRYKI